jgi:hypothetical protein
MMKFWTLCANADRGASIASNASTESDFINPGRGDRVRVKLLKTQFIALASHRLGFARHDLEDASAWKDTEYR